MTAGPDQTRFPAPLLRSPEERFPVQQSAEPGTRLPTIPPAAALRSEAMFRRPLDIKHDKMQRRGGCFSVATDH